VFSAACVLPAAGYDMEDAMILNKSSVDRGLAHASMYKTETVDLREERNARMCLEPEPHDARSRVGENWNGRCGGQGVGEWGKVCGRSAAQHAQQGGQGHRLGSEVGKG